VTPTAKDNSSIASSRVPQARQIKKRPHGERCLGEENFGTNFTDARNSDISNDLKQTADNARYGSGSYSNRHDQSGLNGCCTAM
jgi:hypothetical protein